MARKVRDAKLDTPTARAKLPVSGKPRYCSIGRGVHLGYRKGKRGGVWVLRRYVGDEKYAVESLGSANDGALIANGDSVLDFYQAQDKARQKAHLAAAPAKSGGPFTVADAIADYLQSLTERGQPINNAKSRSDNHILPTLGSIEVAKLKTEELRKWLSALAARPRLVRGKNGEGARSLENASTDEQIRKRRASANRTFTILRAALNYAFNEGKTHSDSAWRKVKPFPEVDVARVRYLSQAEIDRLVNACSEDFRRLVKVALVTGARYGELARLRVEDFNADAGTIHIRMSKSGKGRYVTLGNEGWALLRQIVAGRGPGDLLLSSAGRPWAPTHQTRPMIEACGHARIKPAIGFHVLRHTYASSLVMAGVPLNVVSTNIGHADTKVTEKHYAHLAPSYVADTIRRFSPTFGLAEPSNVVPIVGG